MKNTAPAIPSQLGPGRVVLREADQLCVAIEGAGEVIARAAASCLMRPEPGDRVLVAVAPEPWVLAVLERPTDRRVEIVLQKDAVLRTSEGSLSLGAPRSVELTAGEAVSIRSPSIGMEGELATLVVDRIEAIARLAHASFDELGVVARICDRVAERVTDRAARVFRFVSEYEQLRAQRFDYRAARTAQIKGEQIAICARQVAKMDGEQVHIG